MLGTTRRQFRERLGLASNGPVGSGPSTDREQELVVTGQLASLLALILRRGGWHSDTHTLINWPEADCRRPPRTPTIQTEITNSVCTSAGMGVRLLSAIHQEARRAAPRT